MIGNKIKGIKVDWRNLWAGFDYFATVGFASENATATARVEDSVCDIEVVLDSSFPLCTHPTFTLPADAAGGGGWEEGRKTATVWPQL